MTGTVVEDFADKAGMDLARTWAPVRRWAVVLDDGRLVFADDPELEAESAHPPVRSPNPPGRSATGRP